MLQYSCDVKVLLDINHNHHVDVNCNNTDRVPFTQSKHNPFLIYLKYCRDVTQFGGVPKHRQGSIGGRQHLRVCDGHEPSELPTSPDGARERSAETVRQ